MAKRLRRTGLGKILCLPAALSLFPVNAIADPCQPAGVVPADAITASWYGKEHHGHRGANGSPFDEHRLTAAHPTLPLNAHIMVKNLANGRAVEVTVTDRGPGYGRGIDLSEAAAQAIGMLQCGLATVLVSSSIIPNHPRP